MLATQPAGGARAVHAVRVVEETGVVALQRDAVQGERLLAGCCLVEAQVERIHIPVVLEFRVAFRCIHFTRDMHVDVFGVRRHRVAAVHAVHHLHPVELVAAVHFAAEADLQGGQRVCSGDGVATDAQSCGIHTREVLGARPFAGVLRVVPPRIVRLRHGVGEDEAPSAFHTRHHVLETMPQLHAPHVGLDVRPTEMRHVYLPRAFQQQLVQLVVVARPR